MVEFEVTMPLLGGVLIGVASAMLLLFSGRIAGISGIFGGMLFQQGSERTCCSAFVAGLIGGGVGLYGISPELFANTSERGFGMVAFAGLLVGIGTRIGGGCTSGHGVCGIGRLSMRSIVATVTFVLAGIALVAFVQPFYL